MSNTLPDADVAIQRRAAFVAKIPPNLLEREDKVPSLIRNLNASSRSKLRRVYAVIDDISQVRVPYVACANGCSNCCHMNINITKLEAEQLARATGRRPTAVLRSTVHAASKFAGQPCPFLIEQSCSVYEDRPLSCRKHASFFTSNVACQVEYLEQPGMPMMTFSGLDAALFEVSAEHGQVVIADMRDFFPRSNV
jgi:Fe-S-cluster containining protein